VSALIVDEADQLSEELFEEIRLLGNFAAAGRGLLQIVLVCQNEPDDRLNLRQMCHLKQRIATRLSRQRLNREAVEKYIGLQWSEAGAASSRPFTDEGVDAVATWSCGIPRQINRICDTTVLIAFSNATRTVDAETIREAGIEFFLPRPTVAARQTSLEPAPTTSRMEQPVRASSDQLRPDAPVVGSSNPRPSLVKRCLHRSDVRQSRVNGSKSAVLSLNEPPR
jgi:hypothetical protein